MPVDPKETMTIGELKEKIKDVPDNYLCVLPDEGQGINDIEIYDEQVVDEFGNIVGGPKEVHFWP